MYDIFIICRWLNHVTDYWYGVHTVELNTIVVKFSWPFYLMMDYVVHSMHWIEDLLKKYSMKNWSRFWISISSSFDSNHYIFFHFKSKDHPFNKHMNSDLKANDWSPERGFVDMSLKNDLLGYPRPGIGKFKIWTNLTKFSSASEFHLFWQLGAGIGRGLSILLKADANEYFCSSTNSVGFKILLHNPNDAPKIANFGSSIPIGYESSIIITPKISQASPSIRRMPVNVRECLFEDENFLTFYRTYSRVVSILCIRNQPRKKKKSLFIFLSNF